LNNLLNLSQNTHFKNIVSFVTHISLYVKDLIIWDFDIRMHFYKNKMRGDITTVIMATKSQ